MIPKPLATYPETFVTCINCFYASARLDGDGIMLSTCPSARLSVANLVTQKKHISKTIETIFLQISISGPRDKGIKLSTLVVRRSRVKIGGGCGG